MSYAAVSAGLHDVFAGIEALAVVIEHEPTAVHETPLLYSLLENVERSVQGTHVRTTYTTLHRLCLSWVDPQTSETLLRSLIDAIPEAIEADPRLGHRAADAQITRGELGWAVIGGTEYRIVDYHSVVVVISGYLGLRR